MSFTLIDLKVEDTIATITLNRPENRNALSAALDAGSAAGAHFVGVSSNVAAARAFGIADADVERGEQAGHWADQEFGEVRRDLFDHVLRQVRNARGQNLHVVDRTARGQLEASAGGFDLYRQRFVLSQRACCKCNTELGDCRLFDF